MAAALGAGASYADARVVIRRSQVVGDPQPARRAARRRRERGHRRARARRRRLGLRVRPAARLRGCAGRRREGDRVREGGARRTPAGARAGRACAGRVPDARREGSVRDLACRQGRAVPQSRTCTGARGREGDDSLRACPAGAQGIRLLRGRLDRAGARRVRRRDRRLRHARGDHPDPKPPERTRGLELAGRLGVRRVARARARGATRRRAGGRAAARGPLPVRGDGGRDRRRADAAPDARVGRPPDRARPGLRHRGRLRGHELPETGRSRVASLRLGAHEHHRRLDDARRARDVRLRRRRRARAPRAGRRRWRLARLPHVARDRGADRQRVGRLDARRRLEPDAARADDEPPPRARRGVARRADRGRRRRPLPADEQELVDRRQAPELPVRDADRLGDQGRRARPDAPRRDVHRADARFLGLARRGRRTATSGCCRA